MHRGKEVGANRYEIFDDGMRARVREELALERGLREAIANDEFRVFYQPITRLASGATVAVEALVRWDQPGRGIVVPAAFIPAAEQSGLIVPIGGWVLAEALRQLVEWQREIPGHGSLSMHVNLSPDQLQHPNILRTVSAALAETGADPASLCLEITESSLMADTEATIAQLTALRRLGISIALDDFGTGFSSLSYLHRFPIDVLKVDRSFISDLDRDADAGALVAAIGTSAALRLPVIAEGVESQDHVSQLRSFGYDMAQGYLFARPLSGEGMTEFLEAQPRRRPREADTDRGPGASHRVCEWSDAAASGTRRRVTLGDMARPQATTVMRCALPTVR